MKTLTYRLADWQIASLLTPIRTKSESVMLLMQLIKIMLVNAPIPEDRVVGELRLVVSKMSRLFIFTDGKYVSFRFPFTVIDEDEGVTFSSAYVPSIDSQVTSQVIEVLSAGAFTESFSIWDWLEPIASLDELSPGFWPMLRDLLLSEDGFLRYEHDKERENGRMHPLLHYDVFYSNPVSFKVGVEEHHIPERMVDLLEQETDCHFLTV